MFLPSMLVIFRSPTSYDNTEELKLEYEMHIYVLHHLRNWDLILFTLQYYIQIFFIY